MTTKPRVQSVQVETITTVPGVQVILDLKQAAIIRDVFSQCSRSQAQTPDEKKAITDIIETFQGIGGMDINRNRLHLFGEHGRRF